MELVAQIRQPWFPQKPLYARPSGPEERMLVMRKRNAVTGEEVELRMGPDMMDADGCPRKEVLLFVGDEEVLVHWRNECQRGSVRATVKFFAMYGHVYNVTFAGQDLAFGDTFTIVSIDNT